MHTHLRRDRLRLFLIVATFAVVAPVHAQDAPPVKPTVLTDELPSSFDLRKTGGVTPIKSQQGGTCWTHGTIACIESNLLVSGAWKKLGGAGLPVLSEYHLDWWNGFNKHRNDDVADPAQQATGLTVHQGGDYRVAAAYISRGDGVVPVPLDDKKMPDITSWYKNTPEQRRPERFYVRDIEWFTIGDNLENIDTIKSRILRHGAVGTAYTVGGFGSKDFIQYQPKTDPKQPNHAVAIVGWDDDKLSSDFDRKNTKPGAWLIRNSWGTERKDKKTGQVKPVGDHGYIWISYYDKVCCRDPEMGAVSFRNAEPMKYSNIYYHDYHGWRDTLKEINHAFNIFTAAKNESLAAVSFYTAADNVAYTVRIYNTFENGELKDIRATKSGSMRYMGFHTVDLDVPVAVMKGDRFIVALELSHGGQAIDRTSEIAVLLSQPPQPPVLKKPETIPVDPAKVDAKQPAKKPAKGNPIVISRANSGESFYFDGKNWVDLYEYRFTNPDWATFDRTANFCMKALAVEKGTIAK